MIAGCKKHEYTTTDDDILRIVATSTQAGDLVDILLEGSENIVLSTLMNSGVDPHLYQPTQGDITALNAADLIVYNGLHLEGQFDAVFEALAEQDISIYPLAAVVESAGFIIKTADGFADPHFWFDPRNWALTGKALAEILSGLAPSQGDIFRTNAENYRKQLDMLYNWSTMAMNSVPAEQRYLVSSHDAFQYFGDAFGWNIAAIQGFSTADAAGVGDIQAIVDLILEQNVPVIFVESSIPPNTIEAVTEAVSALGGNTTQGIRTLYSDAMGNTDSFSGTYIGMLAHNVYTILQSYQNAGVECTIPSWPKDLLPLPPDSLLSAALPQSLSLAQSQALPGE